MVIVTITDTNTNEQGTVHEKLKDCGESTCVFSSSYDKDS